MATFGISTYVMHGERLTRGHLAAIAAEGFTAVELFALRTHFDYHDPRAAAELAAWLRHLGLALDSVHAPLAEGIQGGVWGAPLSIGTSDEPRRRHAVSEATRALDLAAEVPFRFLVVHLGVPDTLAGPGDNAPAAVARSVAELQAHAAAHGVRLALEVLPNRLSRAETLAARLEDDADLAEAGICFDFGHAFLMGDLVEAIEAASGHLVTTHVHDNQGRTDEHRLPFDGRIDWDAATMALQKIGYEGRLTLELAPAEELPATLARARRACARLEALLEALLAPPADWPVDT